jgi:L-rhamnose isomerase
MVYKYQPVWKSVADLRFAAINRVLDCVDGDPAYAAKAITRYAVVASRFAAANSLQRL